MMNENDSDSELAELIENQGQEQVSRRKKSDGASSRTRRPRSAKSPGWRFRLGSWGSADKLDRRPADNCREPFIHHSCPIGEVAVSDVSNEITNEMSRAGRKQFNLAEALGRHMTDKRERYKHRKLTKLERCRAAVTQQLKDLKLPAATSWKTVPWRIAPTPILIGPVLCYLAGNVRRSGLKRCVPTT